MKKGTTAAIVSAVAGLVFLSALTVYLTWQHKADVFPSGETQTQEEADAVLATLHETQISDTASAAADTEKKEDELFVIWVGDSRTIGMQNAMDNDDLYIGASGEGYNWLAESGLPQVKDAIAAYPGAPVVFNFGVNDYDNLDRYIELYTSLTKQYPDTHFYFLSVNPIDPAVCKNITNEEIADFNSHLKQCFPETYIDSFTYLMANEVATIDGIHYCEEDYRLIHTFAAEQIATLEDTSKSS
ncbi:MAG: SGNH/GDSL hydrolase family protein [Lachnospiraceae bacterium]|uniref:SGNH/GDSL hydrolase family protein n=1 Tax=Parablautia sp. Marseille-Q6255 TaxID=3039593 RepID=UPI0024BC000C|nr:SGNH/GDSL hydrolase family protein [Parablautia sp. Marseille-Q6255]